MVPGFMIADDNDPETAQLRKIFQETFADALQELPANQRSVFIWNELEDITLQEIADKEGENIKTIISRKRYAVLHLRKRLEFLYNEFLND
jgi:RNA polymerase sigma factor (sigma-70 family)